MNFKSSCYHAAPLIVLSILSSLALAKTIIKETSPGLLAKATYPGAKAIEQVRHLIPKGKIVEAEVEEENGLLIYSFDVRSPGKSGIDEVNISAKDGKLVNQEHEGPKQLAKEKADDKKAAKAEKATLKQKSETSKNAAPKY